MADATVMDLGAKLTAAQPIANADRLLVRRQDPLISCRELQLINLNTISFIFSLPPGSRCGWPSAEIKDSWQGMPRFELKSLGIVANIRYCRF